MFETNASPPMSTINNPFDLTGKIALITGASKGLGKAMALALSRAGASVALVSRDESKLAQVQSEIAAHGTSEIFVADVRQESQVERLEKKLPPAWAKFTSSLTTPASTSAKT